jgi:hypothetical protein
MSDHEHNRPKPGSAGTLGDRIALSEIQHPLLLKALTVWTDLKGARRFPSRQQVTPRAMAAFLRNIVLVRALDNGKEYQFRVVGDAIVEVQGDSFQGLTLAEIDAKRPGYGSLFRPIYDKIIVEGAPRAYRGEVRQLPPKRAFFHESLVLPLGSDDSTVDHILVVGGYSYTPGTSLPDPA